jgi:serine/threonine protein kinase
MSDLVGKTIGKFEITAELGGGGMAEVFKAYQPSLNRYVAIKVIHGFLAKNEEFLARFQREAQNVAALRHPNIVQVHDFDVEDGRPYMVMEFIDGQPLDQVSGQKQATGGWQLADVLQAISDVGYALAYAHKQEMIHRDIKPSNIMWAGTVDDRYILTDFGLAKLLTGQNFTATGTVMGTPAYMSPEQCQGAAGDARTDIYSLGIVLYELATGQLPFAADTQMGYIMKHIAEPPLPPDKVKPDLPTWLTAVILKALTKDPNDRYQTMAEMVADLQRVNDTMMVSPAAATVPVVTADVKTAITDNLRDKAQNVTQFFKTRREKADPARPIWRPVGLAFPS